MLNTNRAAQCCLLGAVLLPPVVAAATPEADVRDIGSRRELFVDPYLIDRLVGTRLELHPPQFAGVAVAYDRPWEGAFAFYTTILKDGDKYRMYYRGASGPRGRAYCYAESTDGIHWTKPDLGLVTVDGSNKNNILFYSDTWAFCPFLDERPGVPAAERFKGNYEVKGGLAGLVSADGLRWRKLREGPLVERKLKNHFDSQNVMFWSPVERQYVLYARHMEGGKRATARSTSKDFLSWTPSVPMTYSDTGTITPSHHLYTSQITPYFRAPHLYISLPGRFLPGRRVLTPEQSQQLVVDPAGGGDADIADGVLQTSRAGTQRFDRTFLEAFIRPGIGYGHWVSRTNYPALGVVPTGPHEMSVYAQRQYGQKGAFLERLALRLDGFASVHASYRGGQMVTQPLRFTGTNLEINYSTSAVGGLRVEIQDASGQALPGFRIDDSPEIIGDEIERIVGWKGGAALGRLAGQPIRLRFVMKDADLYSIRFR
jgi:hypothetical protein